MNTTNYQRYRPGTAWGPPVQGEAPRHRVSGWRAWLGILAVVLVLAAVDAGLLGWVLEQAGR